MRKLSHEQRLSLLQKRLSKKKLTWAEIDAQCSREITFVEKEFGIVINHDYPLMKFNRQFEDLCYFREQENRAIQKSKTK